MPKLMIYPTPLDAHCELDHDYGVNIQGLPDTDSNGRAGQSFNVPGGIPDRNGCTLTLSADGYNTLRVRALLVFEGESCFLYADDFTLTEAVIIPEEPPDSGGGIEPEEPTTPIELIEQIYDTGNYNLATHTGCGLFTEECVRQLHRTFSRGYGHIRKDPGQNQFNGHAVDALMLVVNTMTAEAAIYDIIMDSVSPNARPAFNNVGPADPSKWYYDEALPGGLTARLKLLKQE